MNETELAKKLRELLAAWKRVDEILNRIITNAHAYHATKCSEDSE